MARKSISKKSEKNFNHLILASLAVLVVAGGILVSNSTPTGYVLPIPPPIPNIAATAGNQIATLTMGAPVGQTTPTQFRIYQTEFLSGACSFTAAYTTATPTCDAQSCMATATISGLTNGHTYCFKAKSFSSATGGVSSDSAIVQSTPRATAPSAPQNLVATPGANLISLSWSAPASNGGASITNYKIYRRTASAAKAELASIGNFLSYNDITALAGTTYFYTIAAVNSAGVGDESNEVSDVPTTITAPQPTAPVLTSMSSVGKTLLTWTASAGAQCYKIYRSTASGFAPSDLNIISSGSEGACNPSDPASLYYNDNAVSAGTTYYYVVKARSSSGLGSASNEVSGTPTSGAPVDSPMLATPIASAGKIDLSWSAPANTGGSAITGYKIKRGTSPGAETNLITLGNVLSYSDTSVAAGTTYYYKVSAINSVGEGALSNEKSAMLPTVPGKIQTIGAEYVVYPDGSFHDYMQVDWSAPSNGGSLIQCYKVFRSTTQGSGYQLIGSFSGYGQMSLNDGISESSCDARDFPSNTAGYTDGLNPPYLTENATYYYIVKSINAVGVGPASNEISATVPGVPPTVSSFQSVSAIPNNSANVRTDLPFIIFNFTEPMKADSLTDSSAIISPSVGYTKAFEPNSMALKISFTENLSYAQTYKITIQNLKDLAGNDLARKYSISFSTVLDATTLIVLSSSLNNNTGNFSVLPQNFSFEFNKPISAATDSAITISPSASMAKEWSADGKIVNLIFSNGFPAYSTNYTLAIDTALKDIYGFSPPSVYKIIFRTEDETKVISANIANNSANASVDTNITLLFNREILTSTDYAVAVSTNLNYSKTWSEDNRTLTIAFASRLSPLAKYKLTIGKSLLDINARNASNVYTLIFTTGAVPPTTTTTTNSNATTTTSGATTTTSLSATTATAPTTSTGVSSSDALSAIQEANLAIQSAGGKKDTKEAASLYTQAVKAYSDKDYENAKSLALQAKDAIKELPPTPELPLLYVAIAVVAILSAFAAIALHISGKKNQKPTPPTPEAPPSPPPAPQSSPPPTSRKGF